MYFYKKIMFIQYIWFPFLSCTGFMHMFSNFLCYGELRSLILWKLLCLLVPLSCVLHRHLLSTRRVDTCTATPFDCFVFFVSDLRLRNLLLLTAMSHHLCNNSATLCTMRYYDLFCFIFSAHMLGYKIVFL